MHRNENRCCNIICIYIYLYMKLTEAIKQGSFSDEYQKLVVNIIYTGNWITQRNNEHLKQFGLTVQQYNVLRILRGQHPNPASVNLIIERMLDKMSNASRIVDKLEQKKLATRAFCKDDRRKVDVIITEKGMKLLEEIDIEQKEWLKAYHALSKSEAEEVNNLLDKLRTEFNKPKKTKK